MFLSYGDKLVKQVYDLLIVWPVPAPLLAYPVGEFLTLYGHTTGGEYDEATETLVTGKGLILNENPRY